MERVTPSQIRTARAMLGWSMINLAKAARISVPMIRRYEHGVDQVISDDAIGMMQNAMESEGVCFLANEGNGPGLRFRMRQ